MLRKVMSMSIYEILMLLCFGASWPLALHKSYVSRKTGGKSVFFLYLIVVGYIFGVIHKIVYKPDFVIYLYVLNALMVSADIVLFYRNRRIERAGNQESEQAQA